MSDRRLLLLPFPAAAAILLGGLALVTSACGDDTTDADPEPASDELMAACVSYLTKLDAISETNGCTAQASPQSRCELYHPDDDCAAEAIAEYTCLEAAVTAEDCLCEIEGGYPNCNQALSTCGAEGDASLECFNQGG